MASQQPGQVGVYDNVLATTVWMYPDDAANAVNNFGSRYSYTAVSLAPGVANLFSTTYPASQSLAAPRNIIDGGDFSNNPWQRGTAFTGITNTMTYTADRWAAIGAAGSSISISQQAITNGVLPGFLDALQFGRASSNSDLNPIYLGQCIESIDVYRLQGQPVVLSFYALAGANFSSANSVLNVMLTMGTAVNDGAAKMFKLASSGFTGYALLGPTGGSAAPAVTTGWQRYYVSFTVPTNATELGVMFNYTPVGTAGANDWVQVAGVQLEVGIVPSQFEHRDVQFELEICQRYAYQINEPASGVVVGAGIVSATNTEIFYLALPVTMRTAPTVTVTVGSFKSNSATGGVVAASGLTGNATHTPNAIGLTSTGTGTAGQAALLQGGGASGLILASADL